MLPEPWQTVQRLLLLCHLSDDAIAELEPSMRCLWTCFPTVDIQLLILQTSTYTVFKLDPQRHWSIQDGKSVPCHDYLNVIDGIRSIAADAAIVFTEPMQSPFMLAYCCYLAGIPIRLGQSQEFGGGVLSHCIKPSGDRLAIAEHHLYLLKMAGLPILENAQLTL